jgi:hypothetical protein
MHSYLQLVCQEAVRNSSVQVELRKSVTRRHLRTYQVMEIVTVTVILLQETLLEPYSVTLIYLVIKGVITLVMPVVVECLLLQCQHHVF